MSMLISIWIVTYTLPPVLTLFELIFYNTLDLSELSLGIPMLSELASFSYDNELFFNITDKNTINFMSNSANNPGDEISTESSTSTGSDSDTNSHVPTSDQVAENQFTSDHQVAIDRLNSIHDQLDSNDVATGPIISISNETIEEYSRTFEAIVRTSHPYTMRDMVADGGPYSHLLRTYEDLQEMLAQEARDNSNVAEVQSNPSNSSSKPSDSNSKKS